jgi:RNA polymerase sigma factor (sigma-70 family)
MRARPRLATDDRLVGLVRRGELEAFEILYGRHARELLNFCNYILGSRHDAEDAVQSTFASAYRALMADDRAVDVRPWLFAIARNASLSILRTRKPTSQLHSIQVAREDPALQAEQRESLRQVVATMLELPERQRTALVLAELHGLSQAEIGVVLGVPAEKVKSYIFQARSNLISERGARGADCGEIRQELFASRGAGLLKGRLRRHLRSCEGCRDYARQLADQRGQLGVLLPLAPTLALKRRVLAAAHAHVGGAGASTGSAAFGASLAGTTIEFAGSGVKALVAKLLIGAVGVGAATGAGSAVLAATSPSPYHATSHAPHGFASSLAGQTSGSGAVAAVQAANLIATGGGATADSNAPGRARSFTLNNRSAPALEKAGTTHRDIVSQRAVAQSRGKSAETLGHSGQSHGKSAEAPGHSGEVHGKSAEAPGHSGQAHGNGRPHEMSARAYRTGASQANGASGHGAPHGNQPKTSVSGPAAGNSGVAHAPAPAGGGEAHGAPANGVTNGNGPPASPAPGGEASPSGPPGKSNAGGNGASSSQAHDSGQAPGESHEPPEHPQKR